MSLQITHYQSFEQIITFAKHEYGWVRVLTVNVRSLVQKLYSLKKCKYSNGSYLFAFGLPSKEMHVK